MLLTDKMFKIYISSLLTRHTLSQPFLCFTEFGTSYCLFIQSHFWPNLWFV